MSRSLSKLLLAVWLLAITAPAEPSGQPLPPGLPGKPAGDQAETAAQPWIGLEVGKLNEAMRSHVGHLPEGVGFVVIRVEDQGPAARGGLRRFDILWKLEDQLLINEAQFGTLIRLRTPGEKVALTILRSGKPEVVEVEIGRMPEQYRVAGLDPAEIPIFPSGVPGMPRQIVYPRDRTAEVTRGDGSVARLRYEGDKPVVRIENSAGEEIFEGEVSREGRQAIPEEWRCTVGALIRTMHRSKDKDWQPRAPRPRVVVPPPAGSNDASDEK